MKQHKETKRFYDNGAEKYASLNENNEQMKVFQKMFAKRVQNGLVYDVGCGTGRDTNALTELGLHVIGLDYSNGMLEVARKNHPTCQFLHFDILNRELGSLQKPDGLWACASLLHFEKDVFLRVITNLHHFLKENGYFYLSMKLSDKTCTKTIDGRFFQYYEMNELKELIKQVGFHINETFVSKGRNDEFANFLLQK